jgi:2-polyprenyl-3-methyl-5-hydroxy-6-metoxy-1,4-benzoquinol methylase
VSDPNAQTLRTYEQTAALYRERTVRRDEEPDDLVGLVGEHAAPGATVLEIGSGPGVDADRLEALGFTVRRTDASRAFVELQRADGHDVDVLDVRTDDLGGPYDVVFAHAVLLHIDRGELPGVLARLRTAVRPGGLQALTLKEGDGEAWSGHKLELPRHFTFWRLEPLREALVAAGWEPVVLEATSATYGPWLRSVSRNPTADAAATP